MQSEIRYECVSGRYRAEYVIAGRVVCRGAITSHSKRAALRVLEDTYYGRPFRRY